MRLKFIVVDLLTDASGKHVLKLSHQDYPDKIFSAFVGSIKLEKTGPPNQLFVNDGKETPSAASPNINDVPDDEEDPEPVDDDADDVAEGENEGTADDEPPTDASDGATKDGDWSWSSFFDVIANDARGSHVKSDPSLKKLSRDELKKMEPVDFFNYSQRLQRNTRRSSAESASSKCALSASAIGGNHFVCSAMESISHVWTSMMIWMMNEQFICGLLAVFWSTSSYVVCVQFNFRCVKNLSIKF